MGLSQNYFVEQWLIPALVIFLLIGSVFAFAVGLGLILRSAATFRFFGVMNRWVSMRKALRPAEIPRDADAALHRQSRILGAVFIVAAGLSLIVLVWEFDVAAIVSALRRDADSALVETLAQTVKWLLIVGDALAIVVGIAMIAAPQALAGLEVRANQWISMRKYDKNVDVMHMGVDKWAESYPRALGWSILLLAGFVIANLATLLSSRII